MTKQELEKIKRQVETLQAELNQLEGELQAHRTNLFKITSCKTMETAQKALAKYRKRREAIDKSVQEQMDDFKENYADHLS